MNSIDKTWTLLLIVLLLSSLLVLTVVPVNVQAVSKPSVPQFTVKFVDSSYDVPSSSTTTVDQYTGEKTTHTQPGYRVNQMKAEVTIKNQPFTAYTDENGNKINLYYTVEVKGHFGEDWKNFIIDYNATVQSKSGYTVMSNVVSQGVGSKLDFRVQALVGYEYDAVAESGSLAGMYGITAWYVRSSVTSDWSNIQTVTIPDMFSTTSSQITNQNPTASADSNQPQIPDQTQPPRFVFHPSFLLWVGVLLFAGVAIAVVVMFTKKHLKTPNYNTQ